MPSIMDMGFAMGFGAIFLTFFVKTPVSFAAKYAFRPWNDDAGSS